MSSQHGKLDLAADFVLLLTDAQPRLYVFLLKRLSRRDQTLEVLQNVNLTLCEKATEFKEGTNFMAWAFTVARYQLMAFRQSQAREKLVFSSELSSAINALDERMTLQTPLVDRQSALETCLSKLPADHQKLIIRRYAEAISVQAVAAELGRTANAVSSLLHRIRMQLMNCINATLAGDLNE